MPHRHRLYEHLHPHWHGPHAGHGWRGRRRHYAGLRRLHSHPQDAAHPAIVYGHKPHHIDRRALSIHRDPPGPVKHIASRAAVHQAIHVAAEAFGVSPNLLGTIAYLESKGGDPNQAPGSSQGLFQMQRPTSDAIMAHYGKEIAGILKQTDAVKYKSLTDVLDGRHIPDKKLYEKFVLDATFNSLLGAANTRRNAEAADLVKKGGFIGEHLLADVYSIHMLGTHVRANDNRPLTQIIASLLAKHPDAIQQNAGTLGADRNPNLSGADAFKNMTGRLNVFRGNFVKADTDLGMYKPDPVEATKHAAHGHHEPKVQPHHGRTHPGRQASPGHGQKHQLNNGM